jgi:hypothetical protein
MGKIIFILLMAVSALMAQDSVIVICDEPETPLPVHFRKCNGGFKKTGEKMPDTTGLNNAGFSGSSEYSAPNLPAVINEINYPNITFVDLRQETHFLVNGLSISWYGQYDWADVGLSRMEVLTLEKKRVDSVKNAGRINVKTDLKKNRDKGTFESFKDTLLLVESVQSEEELVKSLGKNYFRITVTDRREPTLDDADRFISFVKDLPQGTWLHFHCHAGDGRTTTFMSMYDMMKNAKAVSCDDIVLRQYLLGGIDLYDDDDYPAYEKPYAVNRTEFMKSFYNYCRENSDGFKTTYSQWLKK